MIKKTVMILAVASMAAHSMGLTALAQEIQNSNVSLGEVEKTQKEVLEEQILAAQKEVDKAQLEFDSQQKSLDEASKDLDTKKKNLENVNVSLNTTSNTTNVYLTNTLVQNQNEMDAAKKELKALEAEKQRLEKESSDAKTQNSQLKEDYKKAELEYNDLLSQGTIEELTNKLKTQQKIYDEASTNYDKAKADYAEVEAKYNDEVSKVNEYSQKIADAQTQLSQFETLKANYLESMYAANDSMNQLQLAYDAATDEKVKAELSARLETEKASLEAYRKEWLQVSDEIVEINGQIDSDRYYVENSQSVLDELKENYNAAKAVLDGHEKQLKEAEDTIANQKQLIDDANAEVLSAKQNLDEKKNQLELYASKESDLAQLVESTRTTYEAIKEQVNKGSLGFYESIEDTQAVDVIKEGIALGTTTLGDMGDATFLYNMKVCMPLLQECNRLRVLNGLPELKTSGLMMAIAQVSNNQSYFTRGDSFPEIANVYHMSESLCGGYSWNIGSQDFTEDVGRGPFEAWYNLDKKYMDAFYEEHPEEKDKEISDTLTRYPEIYKYVSGYADLLNPDYKNTSISFVPLKKCELDFSLGQFVWDKCRNTDYFDFGFGISSATQEGKVYDNRIGQMSVSEFVALFNEYYDNIYKELEATKKAYESALEQALQYEDTSVSDIYLAYQKTLQTLQEKEQAKDALLDKIVQSYLDTYHVPDDILHAQFDVESAQEQLSEMTSSVEHVKDRIETQEKKLVQKKQEYNQYKETFEKRKKDVDALEKSLNLSSLSVAGLKKRLEEQNRLYTYYKNEYGTTCASIENTSKQLETFQLEKTKSEAKVKEYSVQLPSLKEKMDQTKALYDVEKDKYQSLKTKRDRIVSVKNTLDENKQQQVQLTNTIRTNANLLVENQTKTEEIQKNQPILEKESLRLETVSSLYQAIIQDKEENNTVSLNQEEMQLFDALRKAKKAVKEANLALEQVQSFYNTKKDAYDASYKKLEDAKSELALAQLEFNKYLITQKGPGWHKIENDWYYVNASNEIVKDQWVNNYYFESDGKMATNKWIGNYYVDSNGLYTPDKWVLTNDKYWYRHQDGSYTKNDFEVIQGQTYYFDSNGYMVNGWKQVGKDWYYFTSTGNMAKNQWINNYYFENDGKMATNKWIGNYYVDSNGLYTPDKWVLTNDKYWYRHQDGSYTKNDFEVIQGQTYYFDSNGYMVNGWKQVGKDWYYFNKAGHMVKNQWVGNYYFENDGKMATNKWIDNYYVDSNGLYTPDKWVLTNGKYWYRHQDGSYTKNDFEVIQGQTYYFDSNGYMVMGVMKINGFTYYFKNSGVMAKNEWVNDHYYEADGKMATNKWIGQHYVDEEGEWVLSVGQDL